MKSKEELIKQVVILSIALVIVIIIAVVLNVNSKNKYDVPESVTKKVEQNDTNTNNNTDVDEMINNLKGLIDTSNQNQYEDSGTIKEPIKTGVKGELKTENNETIRYEEIWNGDN